MTEQLIHVRVPFKHPIHTANGLWTHRDSWIARRLVPGRVPLIGEAPTREEAVPFEWPSDVAGALVPVNALVGDGPLDKILTAAQDAVAARFGTIKLKVGNERSTPELRDRVAAVRSAIGPDVRLRLDANGAWNEAEAPERIGSVRDFDVEFVEQPIAAAAGELALAAVRRKSPVRIAADESVTSATAARRLLDAGAVDVLVVKPSRVGGPQVAREISALAEEAGLPVVMSTLFETGVGISVALALAATLPPGPAHGLATADVLASDLLARPLEIRDGFMFVPEQVELDEWAIDRYAVELQGTWA